MATAATKDEQGTFAGSIAGNDTAVPDDDEGDTDEAASAGSGGGPAAVKAPEPTTAGEVKQLDSRSPYVVLESSDDGLTWKIIGEALGYNSDSGLRVFFTDEPGRVPDDELQYVAVSRRSFQPRRAAPRAAVKIGDV